MLLGQPLANQLAMFNMHWSTSVQCCAGPSNVLTVGGCVHLQAEHILFVFTTSTTGKLKVLAWQMVNRISSSVQTSGGFEQL